MTERSYDGDVREVTEVALLEEEERFCDYSRVWQPFIERWEEDHLVTAYGAQLEGKTDMGDIYSKISTDGGQSWGNKTIIFDHREPIGAGRYAYANPVLYHPPGQKTIWCYAMRCPLFYRDSEDSRMCAAYSADGGRSWQQVELAVKYHSPFITVGGILGIKVNDGYRYLLPVHRNTLRHDPLGRRDQLVLESTNLLEWELAGYIPQPEGNKVFMHEGNLDFGKTEGEIKIIMRTAEYESGGKPLDPPVAYSSVSTDGGRTWSPGEPEPHLYNARSKAYFGHDHNDNFIYVYSNAYERKELAYKVKRSGGEWSEEKIFYDGQNRNSYPTLLEYEPGSYYAVWDSSNHPDIRRSAIRFGKLHV